MNSSNQPIHRLLFLQVSSPTKVSKLVFLILCLNALSLKININQITQIKLTDEEPQMAGGRPVVFKPALSWTRDKQGQRKLVVCPAFKSHAQTTPPRCAVKEKTMLLRKDQLRQTAWWLNTHFSLAISLLSLSLEVNSQYRMFLSYRPVWFIKYRLMHIHNFPFYSSPSVVFK